MPGRLGAGAATTLTACLRLVSQAQAGRGLSYAEVATRPAVASVVHALASVTAAVGQQLPPSSYCYVFPVLQVGAAWRGSSLCLRGHARFRSLRMVIRVWRGSRLQVLHGSHGSHVDVVMKSRQRCDQ